MFCTNCGKALEAGDLFCGYCGARQEPAQATQENPAVEEPAAGNEGPAVGDAAQGTQEGPAAPVASTSGAGMGTVASGNAAAAPVPGKRSPVVPIVIAVLLVAGAGAGFMLWRNSGVSSSAPKSTVVRSTSVTAPAGLRVETGDGTEWGVHSVKQYYDSSDNLVRQENYGADGQLTLDSDGVAVYEYEYDSAGNMTRVATYGADGRLVADSDGVAVYEFEYDSAGNETRGTTYGADGRLTLNSNGWAIAELEYDSAGNVVEARAYDANGRRVY